MNIGKINIELAPPDGAYFVTICVKDKRCCFGKIINEDEVKFSKLGEAATHCWEAIPQHFPYVVLDAYIIMSNHIHGIIVIDKPVETQNLASLRNKFGAQSQNLASIVRGFKIGVTKYARCHNISFMLQPRFYDRVIRDEEELYGDIARLYHRRE